MPDADFSPDDIAKAQEIANAITLACTPAQHNAMLPFCAEPNLNPITLPLGMANHHVNGLAVSLGTLQPDLRDRLIANIPGQIQAAIEGSSS